MSLLYVAPKDILKAILRPLCVDGDLVFIQVCKLFKEIVTELRRDIFKVRISTCGNLIPRAVYEYARQPRIEDIIIYNGHAHTMKPSIKLEYRKPYIDEGDKGLFARASGYFSTTFCYNLMRVPRLKLQTFMRIEMCDIDKEFLEIFKSDVRMGTVDITLVTSYQKEDDTVIVTGTIGSFNPATTVSFESNKKYKRLRTK